MRLLRPEPHDTHSQAIFANQAEGVARAGGGRLNLTYCTKKENAFFKASNSAFVLALAIQ
jgi:hypothetical protein